MTVVLMSKAELSRVERLLQVQHGVLVIAEATRLLGLTRRQVFRLLVRLR